MATTPDEILDDFGHDIVNNPDKPRTELKREALKQLNQWRDSEVQKELIEATESLSVETDCEVCMENQEILNVRIASQSKETPS